MPTLLELKKAYRCKRRNTVKTANFERHDDDTLVIAEYLIGGTCCYHTYKRTAFGEWIHQKSEA